MNQRLSLENNLKPIIEDTMVNPVNPPQEKMKHSLERSSISTILVEQAKRSCSLRDVSIPTSSQSDKLPSQDEAHEETQQKFTSCCYTSDQVREVLDMEHIIEEKMVIRTIDEDVGLPPSNYQ